MLGYLLRLLNERHFSNLAPTYSTGNEDLARNISDEIQLIWQRAGREESEPRSILAVLEAAIQNDFQEVSARFVEEQSRGDSKAMEVSQTRLTVAKGLRTVIHEIIRMDDRFAIDTALKMENGDGIA